MSNTIDKLQVNSLSLRGRGNQFNKFERLFLSMDDANASIGDGDYVPTAGQFNSVLIAGEEKAIQFWSFDLQKFVEIQAFSSAGNQASKFIDLNGVNSYIGFDDVPTLDALDFTKAWSIGTTFVGVEGPASFKKMTLFGRGGVKITLNAQEVPSDPEGVTQYNWGLYVTSNNDLYNADKRAQCNTWYSPGNFSRVMFTYDPTTRRLKYWLGDPSNGTYAQRGSLLIPQSMIDGQNITGGLEIGNGWTGVGGSTFSGINWEGGVNNLVGSDIVFTGPYIEEYFQNQSTDPDNPSASFEGTEFYEHLTFHCKLGEDTYDDVSDEKGLLTGGKLYNGSASDFKDIPTE